MEGSEVAKNLEDLLSFEQLEQEARASGALQRKVKKLHPVRLLEAMLSTRRYRAGHLSAALSYLEMVHGIEVNRSSFYQRLTQGYARFVHQVTGRVLQMQVARSHPALQGRLEAFRDIWAYDSTTIRLRQALVKHFSSGGLQPKAGIKLHSAVRIRSGVLLRPRMTEERVSDHKGIDLGNCCEDVLILLDRGYSAHAMFESIDGNGGLYLTRLKASTNPTVVGVRSATSSENSGDGPIGKSLDKALDDADLVLDQGPIDVDVLLTLRCGGTLPARVVGLPSCNAEGKNEIWWYLTNLPAELYEDEVVGQFYVLRWQVELLWKQLKSNFSLDKIPVVKEYNVQMLLDLSILGYVLTLGVIQACTTPKERQALSITMVALMMDFITKRLADLLDEPDPLRRAQIASQLRRLILHRGRDPNPKRARKRLLNQLQQPRIAPVSRAFPA
ncbi:MAG: IS4 family transposase [Pseudomonadota bacterium]